MPEIDPAVQEAIDAAGAIRRHRLGPRQRGLVLLMTPGLAFFYGGMIRSKSVLNMLMMSFIAIGVVSVLWVLYGYSLTFGGDVGTPASSATSTTSGLQGITTSERHQRALPDYVFVAFQLMFAIITLALISGAIADRAKFGAWIVFVGPVGHGRVLPGRPLGLRLRHARGGRHRRRRRRVGDTAGTGGWIVSKLGASTSPVAPRCTSTPVRRRSPSRSCSASAAAGRVTPMRPHNLPLVLLGAGLLWFGWFGFNAGSALGANGLARPGVRQHAGRHGRRGARLDRRRRSCATATRRRSASPPAPSPAWSRSPPPARSVTPARRGRGRPRRRRRLRLAVSLKYRLGFDDSLDVVGVHLVGGIVGSLIIGLLATRRRPAAPVDGLLYGGGLDLLGKQAVAVVAVAGVLVRASPSSSA